MQVGLTKGLKAQGNVEDWLCKVEDAMFTSLRRLCKGAIADYQVKSREEWVVAGHPSQVGTQTQTHNMLLRCAAYSSSAGEFILASAALPVCPLGGAHHLSDDVVQRHGLLLGGRPRPLCRPAGV